MAVLVVSVAVASNRPDGIVVPVDQVQRWGGYGPSDGQLVNPQSLVVLPDRTVVVADSGNHRLQVFGPDGAHRLTVGGPGSEPGRFAGARGLALDDDGNLVVADTGNHRLQVLTPDGEVVRTVGPILAPSLDGPAGSTTTTAALDASGAGDDGGGPPGDGVGPEGSEWSDAATGPEVPPGSGPEILVLDTPSAVAVAPDGRYLVADTGNDRVLLVDPDFELAPTVVADATTVPDGLDGPRGVVGAEDGRVAISDTEQDRVVVLGPDGDFEVALGSDGAEDGQLDSPRGLALDDGGSLWVADAATHRVARCCDPLPALDDPAVVEGFGSRGVLHGELARPNAVAIDADGGAWVVDTGNHRVQAVGATVGFRDVSWGDRFVDDIIWMATTGIDLGDAEQHFRPAEPETREELARHLHRLAGSPDGPFADPGLADVPDDHPHRQEVAWLVAEGAGPSGEDDTFSGARPVARIEVARVLHALRGEPAPPGGVAFTDLDPDHPGFAAAAWFSSAGLAAPWLGGDDGEDGHDGDEGGGNGEDGGGDGDGEDEPPHSAGAFGPEELVARDEVAAVLHRFAAMDPPAENEVVPTLVGSAGNVLGNDPTSDDEQPGFWLNISGPGSTKVSGDRSTAGDCSRNGSRTAPNLSGCSASGSFGDNEDYDPDGRLYEIQVAAVREGQDLEILAYDPGFVYRGDMCEQNGIRDDPAQMGGLLQAQPDAMERFTREGDLRWCAGDQLLEARHMEPPPPMDTTYLVREPSDGPIGLEDDDLLDNPVIDRCTRTFAGYTGSLADVIDAHDPQPHERAPDGVDETPVVEHHNAWVPICTIPADEVVTGTYALQVRANADLSDLPGSAEYEDDELRTSGFNRFSLQARWGGGEGDDELSGEGISLVPHDHHAIYVNAGERGRPRQTQQPDGTTIAPDGSMVHPGGAAIDPVTVQVARIDPSQAGSTVDLSFFDLGDVSGGSVTVEFVPPPDSNLEGFPGCRMKRDGDPPLDGPPDCRWSGMTRWEFDGRTVLVSLPIPDDYTCDEADAGGCWVRVHMTFPPGTWTGDTTTWSVGDWAGRVLPGEGPERVQDD